MRELGVDIRLNTAIGRDISLDELSRDYDAVLLAVGAQRSQRLGADLLWLVYVALRDLLIVSGVVMSFMFYFPMS